MTYRDIQLEYVSDLEARLKWRGQKLAQARTLVRKAKAAFSQTATGEDLDRMVNAEDLVKAIQAAIKTETVELNRLKAELMGESV